MTTEVIIVTRADKEDEKAKVQQIENLLNQAASVIRKQIHVTVTSNFSTVANLSVNVAMTPIVIINGTSAFSKNVPSLAQVKEALATVTSSGEFF